MKRPALRAATVLGVTAYVLTMGAVLASGTATAERPESPGATFTGPVIVLPIQARENSEASLHSPQATLFQGRKFR
jgi:hypothetical protein